MNISLKYVISGVLRMIYDQNISSITMQYFEYTMIPNPYSVSDNLGFAIQRKS